MAMRSNFSKQYGPKALPKRGKTKKKSKPPKRIKKGKY